jgi:hypothetical protein
MEATAIMIFDPVSEWAVGSAQNAARDVAEPVYPVCVSCPIAPGIARRAAQSSSGFRYTHFRRRVLLGLVGAHFCPWRARRVRRAARGATARTTDRPFGAPQPVFRWISNHPLAAGVCSFSRPSPHCGDTGVEMGRLWVFDSVHLRNFAWNLRLACGAGRYGHRCDRPTGVVRSPAPARFCGGQELCGLEHFRYFGPHRGREYRGAHPAAGSQFLRNCFDGSNDTAAAGADSNLFRADILDIALDCAVSGATSRQIKQRDSPEVHGHAPGLPLGGPTTQIANGQSGS